MGRNSAIAWTDHTFNPWWGCVKVSQGCANCYAEARQYGGDWWGKDKPRRFFGEKHWNDPVRWNVKAKELGTRYKVFCASYGDVFEDREDLVEPRKRLGELILNTPYLDWLILTKRPENVRKTVDDLQWQHPEYNHWQIPDNVWMGVTVENQQECEARIPLLEQMPAKVRWLSAEPLLMPIYPVLSDIHWLVVGGESGTNCRPMGTNWARILRDHCEMTGTAFFMKQLGGHPNKRKEMEDFPEDLRIREFPNQS